MNVQRNLMRELKIYEFEQGHNTVETIKSICRGKGRGVVDHNTVTRWLLFYFTQIFY